MDIEEKTAQPLSQRGQLFTSESGMQSLEKTPPPLQRKKTPPLMSLQDFSIMEKTPPNFNNNLSGGSATCSFELYPPVGRQYEGSTPPFAPPVRRAFSDPSCGYESYGPSFSARGLHSAFGGYSMYTDRSPTPLSDRSSSKYSFGVGIDVSSVCVYMCVCTCMIVHFGCHNLKS